MCINICSINQVEGYRKPLRIFRINTAKQSTTVIQPNINLLAKRLNGFGKAKFDSLHGTPLAQKFK